MDTAGHTRTRRGPDMAHHWFNMLHLLWCFVYCDEFMFSGPL